MKCIILLSLAVAAFAVPVDQAAYKKPDYKEVEYKEPAAPVKEAEHKPAPKYEEPVDKTIYPYVVSRAFPYDYRGFPYLNNEFPHGYPHPKGGYFAPLYPYYQGAPAAYNPAPVGYAPAGRAPAAHAPARHAPVAHAPAAHAPAAHAPVAHAPAVHSAPAQPSYKIPVPQAPAKKVEHKPKYDSMKYYGQFAQGCLGDGIYYNNLESFILCSNGNPYVQRCAPGTKNSGADHYSYGSNYSFKDLCGINLVDTGYGPSNVVY